MVLNDKAILVIPGNWIARAHSIIVWSAFAGALVIAFLFHYVHVVKNEFHGYPNEWFPTISASVGDWPAERVWFQLGMALASGPRFFSALFLYFVRELDYRRRREDRRRWLTKVGFVLGIARMLAAGWWVYITSTTHMDLHVTGMIVYLAISIAYHFLQIYLFRDSRKPLNATDEYECRKKLILASLFVLTLPTASIFFVYHKIYAVAGAYSWYAIIEWTLVVWDVGFDATCGYDFSVLELTVAEIGQKEADH